MLNCVIIEDEFPAREELKYFINNNNNFQINKEFENISIRVNVPLFLITPQNISVKQLTKMKDLLNGDKRLSRDRK